MLSQRTVEKSAKSVVTRRLTPTASAFAKRYTNMSTNAFALYFSARLVGM